MIGQENTTMKTMNRTFAFIMAALLGAAAACAATTINAVNNQAYGANVGWLNARGDNTNGTVIGQSFCSGSIWGANVGWIGLGNGPTNGFHYSNSSATDWGVNHDGTGNLRGYAYGANVGWLAFETNGNPRLDLLTGALSGYAWGANVGWISLSNAQAFVQTDSLAPGPDSDGDGIPDAFELAKTGSLTNLTAIGDYDDDGVPDVEEYRADTHPGQDASYLHVTDFAKASTTGQVTWTVSPTRLYRLEHSPTATNGAPWVDSGLGIIPPGAGPTLTRSVAVPATTTRFFRAKAVVPLQP
jgi:hypothetical protein